MAERALRGTRLGSTSYENDRNTDLAPRQEVAFDCPKGHHFTVPFAAEAELPPTWEHQKENPAIPGVRSNFSPVRSQAMGFTLGVTPSQARAVAAIRAE